MADVLDRVTALVAWRADRKAALESALFGIGLALPAMGHFTEAQEGRAAGLLLARVAPHQALAMREGVAAGLMAELAPVEAAAGLIDLCDSRVTVRMAGPGTRARLALLLPLDLHPDRFGVGRCAQTLMAHLSVTVLQTGEEAFELQCGRSFAASFLHAVAA